jgi:hypothetical protein
VVERLHPLIHPLAPMLPGASECFAVQLARIDLEDLAAQPFDRLHLDPLGAAQPAGRLDRPDVALEGLGAGQRLQVLHALSGRPGLEDRQQGTGGQLGARVSSPHRRAPLLPGGGVQALEHRPHLLGTRDPVQAGRGGGAADEPPR